MFAGAWSVAPLCLFVCLLVGWSLECALAILVVAVGAVRHQSAASHSQLPNYQWNYACLLASSLACELLLLLSRDLIRNWFEFSQPPDFALNYKPPSLLRNHHSLYDFLRARPLCFPTYSTRAHPGWFGLKTCAQVNIKYKII